MNEPCHILNESCQTSPAKPTLPVLHEHCGNSVRDKSYKNRERKSDGMIDRHRERKRDRESGCEWALETFVCTFVSSVCIWVSLVFHWALFVCKQVSVVS